MMISAVKNLPDIGEKLIVNNIRYATATVADLIYSPNENRIIIELKWTDNSGLDIGKSRVYHHDENKIWFRAISNS